VASRGAPARPVYRAAQAELGECRHELHGVERFDEEILAAEAVPKSNKLLKLKTQ
jgi:hypothetical protein